MDKLLKKIHLYSELRIDIINQIQNITAKARLVNEILHTMIGRYDDPNDIYGIIMDQEIENLEEVNEEMPYRLDWYFPSVEDLVLKMEMVDDFFKTFDK